MRIALILMASGCLLTACRHRADQQKLSGDEKLRQQLIGVWHNTNGFVVSLNSDGRCSSSWTIGTKEWKYQMTWSVKDGYIVSTVTDVTFRNTTNYEAVGHTTRIKVIQVDDHDLVYGSIPELEGGITNSLSR